MIGASTRIENAVLTDPEIAWIDTVVAPMVNINAMQKNIISNIFYSLC